MQQNIVSVQHHKQPVQRIMEPFQQNMNVCATKNACAAEYYVFAAEDGACAAEYCACAAENYACAAECGAETPIGATKLRNFVCITETNQSIYQGINQWGPAAGGEAPGIV